MQKSLVDGELLGLRVLDPSAFGSSPYQGEQFREGFMKPYDEYPLSLGRGLG